MSGRRSRARPIFLGVFGVERKHATLQAERLDKGGRLGK
jgi:hypothetical protein